MLGVRRFGENYLEEAYQRQQLNVNVSLLVNVLCTLVLALVLLATNHLFWKPDLVLILSTTSASFALGLSFLLHFRSSAKKKDVIIATGVWLCLTIICMLPAGGQFGLLPTIIAYFAFYTIFPFDITWIAGAACGLSLAQAVSFVAYPRGQFTVDQLLAVALVHIWCNFIGLYLFSTRNRLCRAAFLNARNALTAQQESIDENSRMGVLLSSALPWHVISTVQNQVGLTVPKLFAENYTVASVLYAKLYGLERVLSQISVQDAARLLNEFNSRIDLLTKRHGCIRIQSEAVVVLSGAPDSRNDHAFSACRFAKDLLAVIRQATKDTSRSVNISFFRSFNEATTAEIRLKIGIGTGSLSAGLIGARKWHYDIVGTAYDTAKELEEAASFDQILVSEPTKNLVESVTSVERTSTGHWKLRDASTDPRLSENLLFPSQRRFSLMTLNQAVNRLLQTTATPANEAGLPKCTVNVRRRKKASDSPKVEEDADSESDILRFWTMRFADSEVEKGYHLVMDRWFIPALAISIFFLVVYGIYQVLVMPRLITTLALIIIALAVMFVVLLMLYVNYFESFCQFVTRTSAGHSIAILLIMVLLYTCGMVNTFSCPSLAVSRVCQAVHYSTISVVLWMLTTAVFVRFPSLYLLGALSLSIGVYCVHLFVTHADLYIYYSEFTGWRLQVDILIGLFTLALLIYLQARRNERMIRLDYLSLLKAMDERRKLERFEYINEQILLNALPTHIAYNYLMRTDPYCHLCHTVGVISAKFGNERDWQGEAGFNRLANLVYKLDRMAEGFKGVEKVRSAHCVYTAAVGVLPEVNVNINDVPHTIGDLLAALANFAVSMCKLADEEGIDLAVGIDCGAALSVVIGGDRPRYDVIGIPCIRSQKLVKAARRYKVLVSEDVYLALRPRHFTFDDHHPMKLEQGLSAYGLVDVKNAVGCNQITATPLFYRQVDFAESRSMDDAGSDDVKLQDETTQSTTCHTTMDVSIDMDTKSRQTGLSPTDTSPMRHHNPLEMFASMNSSFSSEMYSIDVSVDDAATDSDLEWITPEMLSRERAGLRTDAARSGRSAHPPSKHPASASVSYKGDRAKQYSDFSEYENPAQSRTSLSSRMRRKRFRPSISRNGPKLPSWLSSRTSFNSEMSIPASVEGSSTALDRLNAAARRVDKMLHELASVDNYASPSLPEAPFPVNLGGPMCTSVHSVNSYQREMSSACQTEYDNADSDGACSDSEMIATSRLERLKRALKGSNTTKPPAGDNRRQKKWRYGELSGPSQRRLRHDNGNDADVDSICSSLASSVMFDRLRWKSVHSIGYENEYELVSEREDSTSVAGAEDPFVQRSVGAGINFPPMDADSDVEAVPDARTQVEALSRDIRQNFGDYQLASFSDIDR